MSDFLLNAFWLENTPKSFAHQRPDVVWGLWELGAKHQVTCNYGSNNGTESTVLLRQDRFPHDTPAAWAAKAASCGDPPELTDAEEGNAPASG